MSNHEIREIRELRFRLKLAHKAQGRQGQTIANLRGELARVREDNSKLDRGELRRLQRFEEMAKEQFSLDHARLEHSHKEIVRLKEKVERFTYPLVDEYK